MLQVILEDVQTLKHHCECHWYFLDWSNQEFKFLLSDTTVNSSE